MRRPILRQPPDFRRREKGVAMLEFVLMLPFIWIILILIFNFGQIFLAKHRALVAVREMGIRHSQATAGSSGGVAISSVATDLAGDTLRARGMSAQFARRSDGVCPGPRAESADENGRTGALFAMTEFLSRISSAHAYEATAGAPPLVGRLLANRTFDACFAIDGSPWTIHETGEPLGWLAGQFGRLGRIASAVF